MTVNFKAPDSIAQEISARLCRIIQEEIASSGPISFARFMELALYTPQLGYYQSGSRKLGAGGDFVTAPEISPLFSQCLAKQCQQVLRSAHPDIFEIGAGSGVMALDILRYLKQENNLPEHYYILEVSPDLKERQQQLFAEHEPELLAIVQWLDRWPEKFSGAILGNEVLDAFPVHKFKWEKEIKEYFVNWVDQKFVWELHATNDESLIHTLKNFSIDFADGYESEVNLLLKPWIANLADLLQSGLILLIDYGFPRHEYYHPDRNQGTLMCHYQHQAHNDPFYLPGLQDITAHVDFTSVAEAAYENGLTVEGFIHQAGFLLNCGITDLMQQNTPMNIYQQNQAVKRLLLPHEMGELFKVIALTKNFDDSLLGFAQMNQLARL